MNQDEIEQIRREIEDAFLGRRFGKVFPLSRSSIAIDFYPHNGVYLFIDFDAKRRKAYLIRRRLRDLERSSVHSSPFVIQLRKMLSGRELAAVAKDANAKVLRLKLVAADAGGEELTLVIQLGGKIANIFVLDAGHKILAGARAAQTGGQAVGDIYIAPVEDGKTENGVRDLAGRSLSDLLDEETRSGEAENDFSLFAAAARKKINAEIAKRRKLIKNLEGDLAGHGDAEEWKRFGDLILANISTLRRDGDTVIVTDYFHPDQAELVIGVDKNDSPTEAAEGFFRRYAKARNGAAAIANRLETVNAEITNLETRKEKLEAVIEAGDEAALTEFLPAKQPEPIQGKRKEKSDDFKGARKFVSTDGFEILVGKKAKDNDYLTFRVAKSLDLWLHAADYPGSHVVVRNPNRKEIPARTLIEAAQLAAFYSDAREKPKAAVNYTPRKFVNKPKRSAPGLVSLASFKTILVEPMVVGSS
jgi:predicted ribosome quality control (RQC) complex YloA/Tae2 family protein